LSNNIEAWVDFSRGLDERRGNGVSGVASEMPMRNQFEAWVEYMTAEGH
jgi:hypothetical protein